MKKIDLGQTIGIVANVGVIAGIVLLAFELQQNNELLRAEADYNYLQQRLESRRRTISDPEFAQFWLKAKNNESLTEVDRLRLTVHIEETILIWQWEYGQHVDGNRTEDQSVIAERYRVAFPNQGDAFEEAFLGAWPSFRNTLRADFVEWMEENVVKER